MKLEEAAGEAGLPVDEAKALVDQGLVTPDPASGEFDAWRVAQFSVAKRARDLGVADADIAGLMAFFTKEAASCAEMAAQAERQRAAIEAQLAELQAAKTQQAQLKGAA